MEKLSLLYSPETGILIADGVSSALDNRDNEGIFQRELESIIGPVARTLLYNASKSLTEACMAGYYRGLLDKGMKTEEMLGDVMSFLQRRGFGLFETKAFNLEKKNFTITVRNSFNAMGYSDCKNPVCCSLSGILAGILEPLVKCSLECKETSCIGMGHEACEFQLESSSKNEFPKEYFNAEPLKDFKGLEKLEVDIDRERGELVFEDTSSLLDFREHDAFYQREFERTVGPAIRSIMYYYLGKYTALKAMTKLKRILIRIIGAISVEPLAKEFAKRIPQRGYGVLENLNIDGKKKEITFNIKNCYNAMGYRKAREPVCFAFAGVAAGSTCLLFNEDSDCVETSCVGAGDRKCSFKTFARKQDETLLNLLREISRTPGIRGSIVFLENGVIMGSSLPEEVDPNSVTARIGVLTGTGQNASGHLNIGKLDRLYVNSSEGTIITRKVEENAFLAILVRQGANMGIVELAIDRALKRIARLL